MKFALVLFRPILMTTQIHEMSNSCTCHDTELVSPKLSINRICNVTHIESPKGLITHSGYIVPNRDELSSLFYRDLSNELYQKFYPEHFLYGSSLQEFSSRRFQDVTILKLLIIFTGNNECKTDSLVVTLTYFLPIR